MPYLLCEKCGSQSWIAREGRDYIQRCICGLYKYLLRVNSDGSVSLRSTPKSRDIYVPQKDTKLYKCLLVLVSEYPRPMSTISVSIEVGVVKGDTASMLIVLMHKGLVNRVKAGKGIKGGSIWELTPSAITYFKLRK